MSQINTNGINTNYPVPGQNNSSQGFRDNFSQIKTQLDTGASEITDLQSKALLKAALNNSTLNNDMANTLISNASTRGFRATTYNLGNALSGTVLVDVNRADVQIGAITGNVTLQFGGWSPTNTESNVVLRLTVANANATISLPSSCVSSNNDYGVTLLENYANIANVATLTAPANTSLLEYTFSTIDCGNTVIVSPINRSYKSTQIVTRDPPPTGLPGDTAGDVAMGSSIGQLTITSSAGTSELFTTSGNTSQLYPTLPIVFTGTSFEANITAGTTYYVRNVYSSNTFTVSSTLGGANVNLAGCSSPTLSMYANPATYLYLATGNFNSTPQAKQVQNTYATGNLINLDGTANLVVNAPIVFTGNVFGGIVANTVYYITSISSPNISVSQTRVNGVAGANIALADANGTAVATCYTGGNDIWNRISLTPW
jgi:hypothetical protein